MRSLVLQCPFCRNVLEGESIIGERILLYRCENNRRLFRFAVGDLEETTNRELRTPSGKIKILNLIYEFIISHNGGDYLDPITNEVKDFYQFEYYHSKNVDRRPNCVDLYQLYKNYPNSTMERMDRALLNISRIFKGIRETFTVNDIYTRAIFVEDGEEKSQILNFLIDLGFLYRENGSEFHITPKGWNRIEFLTREKNTINQGFIAMELSERTVFIKDTFAEAINECGYSQIVMTEKEHNNQIVPEMFYQIARSKFLVVDMTYPNFGAYYEAGYGQALGKEVIVCCRKTEFESNDRSKKPHFDIAQKPMIVWNNEVELKDKLKKRIQSTVK